MGATTAKDAWDKLKEEFQGSKKVISIKVHTLWRQLDALQMKEEKNIQDFYARVSNITNQTRNLGKVVDDQQIIHKIMRSLPRSYDHIVAVIEEAKDLDTLTSTELMGSLQSHEDRMKKNPPPPHPLWNKLCKPRCTWGKETR